MLFKKNIFLGEKNCIIRRFSLKLIFNALEDNEAAQIMAKNFVFLWWGVCCV